MQDDRKEIHDGLIEFGYLDPEMNKLSRSRVLPGYVFSHPKVVDATIEVKRLKALYSSPVQGTNRDELQNVEEAIIVEKRRLLNADAGLAVR